ncbi:6337_t:CDS:2 [Ambispora gerdemannii]|uniref:6337_t:CDS:1 n=1 Tax=Ambispora gerdemannii TaxID=144530 RepID=A0A9N8YZI6_9GLOM|nr:6337_t:CDS:2 [Ambispora gerdemannii]
MDINSNPYSSSKATANGRFTAELRHLGERAPESPYIKETIKRPSVKPIKQKFGAPNQNWRVSTNRNHHKNSEIVTKQRNSRRLTHGENTLTKQPELNNNIRLNTAELPPLKIELVEAAVVSETKRLYCHRDNKICHDHNFYRFLVT